MEIVEFAHTHDIKWRPIKVKVSMGAKGKFIKDLEPIGALGGLPNKKDFLDAKWCENTMPVHQQYYLDLPKVEQDKLTISMDTTDIYHLDVDWLETKEYSDEAHALVEKLELICPYYKSKTKVLGKHLFFRLEAKLEKQKNLLKLNAKCKVYEDLEVLSGNFGWCGSSEVVVNSNLPIPLLKRTDLPLAYNAPYVGDVKKESYGFKKKIAKKEPIQECEDLDKTSKIFKYADIIEVRFIDEYDSWLKLMWALKSEGEKAVAHYISQKSDKFKESEFNKRWDNIEPLNISIGTLYYYAKISDKQAYRNLQHEDIDSTDFLDSDDTQAKIFLRNHEDNLVYKDNQIYLYLGNEEGTEGRWFMDDKNERVKKILSDYLSGLQISYVNKLYAESEAALAEGAEETITEERKEEISGEELKRGKQIEYTNKLIAKLKNCAKINTIAERLRSLLSVKDFQEIEFDRNPYLLPFNNTCYDLKSHNWVGTRRENYILETTGYNWKTPTDSDIKKIDKLIKEIFPDKVVRQEYVHYLTTGLYGIPIEKFILACGGGGNGKGVINELMMEVVGNFGYSANNAVLLNPLKDGGNPAIANMSGKRFITYREPDEKKALNLSAVKELTGGKGICARKLYHNEDKVELVGTHILELNKKCAMVGDLGDSIMRRLRDIPFVSTYTTDVELLANKEDLNYIFKANPYYKTIDFQDEFKYALFIYLVRYAKKWEQDNVGYNVCSRLFVSDRVTERTKLYIEDNDHIFTVLKQHYTKDMNKSSFVKFKEFWMYFKDSDFYRTLSKHEQNKTFSEKQVIEHLQTSTSTRIFFKEKLSFKKENGDVITYRNVLRFWRHKTDDEVMKEQLEDESGANNTALVIM
tara:strand:+ start:2188 stop:4776 length:2589 start_codon:yes stop_codon:yes gene_type:complete